MTQLLRSRDVLAWLAASWMVLALTGCPTAERPNSQPPSQRPAAQPPAPQPAAPTASPTSGQGAASSPTAEPARSKGPASVKPVEGPLPIEETAEKPRDLGPPLVDNVDKLKPLQPESLVWLDMQNRQVVFLGQVCRADYPLEFFVTYREKSYESIIASDVKPWLVHTGLLALGAEAGHPVRFQPDFVPPSGTEVAIEVRWKDAEGKVRSSPARDWVRNVKTKEPLDTNWVFAGSALVTDEATGERHYLADGGDFVCLLNLPDATLDLPIRSASSLESRSFEAFLEHLPPAGTPVTILLKPKIEKKEGEP